MITLRIIEGPEAGNVFTPSGNTVVIGRGRECEVVLSDGAVSRRHCTIERQGNTFLLTDLQSANRTFLNDLKTPVTTYTLKHTDEILLGKTRIRVEFSPAAPAAGLAAVEGPEGERTLIQESPPRSEVPARAESAAVAPEQLSAVRQPDVPIIVTVISGPDPTDRGKVYAPAAENFSIGRSDMCVVVLRDPRVSGTHALIKREGGKYRIYDENSRNGTFLRTPQARIFHSDLTDGDVIYLGDTQLRVAIHLGSPATTNPEEGTIIAGRVGGKDFTFTLAAFPLKGQKEGLSEELTLARPAEGRAAAPAQASAASPQIAAPRVVLRIVEGKEVGAVFEPKPGQTRFTIGRGEIADWRINDHGISRVHFAIEVTRAGVVLIDDNSLNGTFLNQGTERISRVELKGGEEIRFSETRLKVEILPPEEKTVVVPSELPQKAQEKPPEPAAQPAKVEKPAPPLAPTPEPHVVEEVRSRSAAFKERLAKISKQKGMNLRPMATSVSLRQGAALLLMLIAAASSYGFLVVGRPSFFSAGPVSKSHAEWEQQCATCHPPWRGQQMNASCATEGCHHTQVLKASETIQDDCVSCHAEHRGRRFNLAGGETLCWSCHEKGLQVRRFQERPLRVYYEKVLSAGREATSKRGKEGPNLRIQPPTSEEERRLWQLSVPHVESGLKFAHVAHEKDSDLAACDSCHKSLPGGVINAFPSHAECIGCHNEVGDRNPQIAKTHPAKQCLKCHTREDGEVVHVQRDITYVRFSHDDHRDTKCLECHFVVSGELEYRTVLRSSALYPLPMDACYTCHKQKQATTACLDCHSQHHSYSARFPTAGRWLSKVSLGGVLFAVLTMVVGAGAYTYFDMRLARRWLMPSRAVPPATPASPTAPVTSGPAAPEGKILPFPTIDAATCIACGSCIDSCPTSVLAKDPNSHKSSVINANACKALEGCTICQDGCPTGSIRVTSAPLVREVERPQINESNESNIPGLFLVGEVVGAALIKKAVNQGDQTVRYIAEKKPRIADAPYDVIVVGAGPGGISAALQAKKQGLRYLLLERESLANTVQNYPRDKAVLAEPVPVPLFGMLPMMDAEKETLIAVWKAVVQTTGLQVNEHEEVSEVKKTDGLFTVTTVRGTYQGAYVILAIGTQGNPRKLGVPGEDLSKVAYNLIDAADLKGKHVLVIGGGDSAIEAAVALAKEEGTTVSLSYRRGEFSRVKSRNAQAIAEQEKAGRVTVIFNSNATTITEESVKLKVGDTEQELANDFVFVLVGADPPKAWLEKIGVNIVTLQETINPQW